LKVPRINGYYVSPGTIVTDIKRSVQSRLKLYKRQPPLTKVGSQSIIPTQEAHKELANAILRGTSFAAGRLGTVEGDLLSWRIQHPRKPFPLGLIKNSKRLAGIYPANQSGASEFVGRYLDAVENLDLLGVRNNDFFSGYFKMERTVVEKTKPKALCPIEALSPLGEPESWVRALSGKKVLVIHPFASTITNQYRHNISEIYPGERWLPQFQLEVLKPFQTAGDDNPPGEPKSWNKALDATLRDVSRIDFDVALIAAGGYGLPLASEIKRTGKVAIHVGGILQLFFGIKGGRFDSVSSTYEPLALYQSEAWVRPAAEETPTWKRQVEGGAYW